uniref:Uncharacterized protein n=1 Tax=Arundo donax TaxID=35708 RepID=A0A0A9BXJ8_ARUDO
MKMAPSGNSFVDLIMNEKSWHRRLSPNASLTKCH